MDTEKIIAEYEQKLNRKITWFTACDFYTDSRTKKTGNDVLLMLTDITFYVYSENFSDSFTALDIFYTETVLKDDVLSFLAGRIPAVKRANPFRIIGKETLTCLEFEKHSVYLHLKDNRFRQILRIAQAKQKYSRTIDSENRP